MPVWILEGAIVDRWTWLRRAAALLLLTAPIACGEGRPLEVTYHAGLDLRGSLYLPPQREDRPVPGVVLVHGGCFEAGSRKAMQDLGRRLATRGIAALAIDYRLVQEGGAYPAAVEDVRCAVRWLREQGLSRGIEPERLGLLGASAGGFLAAKAALDPEEPASCDLGAGLPVRAVVVLYAVSDWALRARTGIRDCERRFLAEACDPDRPESCLPVSLVARRRFLPTRFLILHGSEDRDIPLHQSQRLLRHLLDSGVDASLETYPGAAHGFDLGTDAAAERARAQIVDFLSRALGLEPDASTQRR